MYRYISCKHLAKLGFFLNIILIYFVLKDTPLLYVLSFFFQKLPTLTEHKRHLYWESEEYLSKTGTFV